MKRRGDFVNKRKIIISFFSLIFSIFAFMFATYAWFAVSTSVNNSPLNINVDPGIITSYEVHYYTNQNIFKSSSSDRTIYIYNSGWVPATHTDLEDIDALDDSPTYDSSDYWGVVMKPYDTLISENNLINNIIIGIHLTYEIDVNTELSITAVADENIGHAARDAFGVSDGAADEFYLSQVINMQMLPAVSTDVYGFNTNGSNLYFTLMDDAENLFTDTTTYPYNDFYSGETYVNSISFYDEVSPYQLNSPSGDVYIYFNLSYNGTHILDILSGLLGGDLGQIQLYRFFQDITLVVRKEGEVV